MQAEPTLLDLVPPSPAGPEAPDISVPVTMALLVAADRTRRRVADVLGARGVTLAQYSVLRVLRQARPEGLPTLEAGRQLIEHAPGITRMMDRLEARGWVVRRRGRGDRRQVLCALTTAGRDLVDALEAPVAGAMREGLDRLDPVQRHELLELLSLV